MAYYRIQLEPFEELSNTYVHYSRNKGFYLGGKHGAIIIEEGGLIDEDLWKFLEGKPKRLVETKNKNDIFGVNKYRTKV